MAVLIIYYLGFIVAAAIAISKKPTHISPWFVAILSWVFVIMAIVAWWNSDTCKRRRIYKKMLVIAECDLYESINCPGRVDLFGFCDLLRMATDDKDANIRNFPELMAHKPEFIYTYGWWFDTDPNGTDATKRIDILKEIISKL